MAAQIPKLSVHNTLWYALWISVRGPLSLSLYLSLSLFLSLPSLFFLWKLVARAYIHKSSGAVVSEEETVPIKKSKNQARKSSHAKQHYSLFRNLLRAEHWESVKCLQKINSIRKKVMKLDRMNRRVFVLVRSNFLLVANKIKLARHLHDKSAGVKKYCADISISSTMLLVPFFPFRSVFLFVPYISISFFNNAAVSLFSDVNAGGTLEPTVLTFGQV